MCYEIMILYMKRSLLVSLLGIFVLSGFSQVSERQIGRYIYLWDVTLSMQGYNNETPDIWDDVVKIITNHIGSISDESTELVVLPFQEEILTEKINESWNERATSNGKAKMYEHINDAKNKFKDISYTNISGPFKQTMDRYIDSKRNNVVILLTDGKQSNKYGGQSQLLDLLSKWDAYAHENNAYLIYVMLTDEARDYDVIKELNKTDRGEALLPEEVIDFKLIEVSPIRQVSFNIIDDSDIHITLNKSTKDPLPDGLRFAVKSSENSFIEIYEEVEVVNNILNVSLKHNVHELRDKMGAIENMSIPLTLELLNSAEGQKNDHKRVVLTRNDVDLKLINKIQKKMTIQLKR